MLNVYRKDHYKANFVQGWSQTTSPGQRFFPHKKLQETLNTIESRSSWQDVSTLTFGLHGLQNEKEHTEIIYSC